MKKMGLRSEKITFYATREEVNKLGQYFRNKTKDGEYTNKAKLLCDALGVTPCFDFQEYYWNYEELANNSNRDGEVRTIGVAFSFTTKEKNAVISALSGYDGMNYRERIFNALGLKTCDKGKKNPCSVYFGKGLAKRPTRKKV